MKRLIPSSPVAWPCVILALDPAKTSGWAIFARGTLVASGKAETAKGRHRVVELAVAAAHAAELPLLVAAERWSAAGRGRPGRARSFSLGSLAGLGAAWGAWADALEVAEVPSRLVVRVLPRTWQSRVFHAGRQPPRDVVTRMAIAHAARLGRMTDSPDEAHAICIGAWATHAVELGELLTLKQLEAHGIDTRMRRARSEQKRATRKAGA